MKVLYIITDLDVGGAERALLRLLQQKQKLHEVYLISMVKDGVLLKDFQQLDIQICNLNLDYGQITLPSIIKFIKIINSFKPDIIHSWMYHANILAFFCSKLSFQKVKLVWGIRQCLYSNQPEKPLTKLIIKLSSLVSRYVDVILYNSDLSLAQHLSYGLSGLSNKCIPNGFEIPKNLSKVTNEIPIIGMVGRYHEMKDYLTAFKAFEHLSKRIDFKVILIGKGLEDTNEELQELLSTMKLNQISLFGPKVSLAEYYSSFDCFLLSSSSESFPNVLAEAMSYGCICVSTDVGDCSKILQNCGYLSDARDSVSLSDNMYDALTLSSRAKEELSLLSKNRIKNNYSIQKITQQYHQLYERLICAE